MVYTCFLKFIINSNRLFKRDNIYLNWKKEIIFTYLGVVQISRNFNINKCFKFKEAFMFDDGCRYFENKRV